MRVGKLTEEYRMCARLRVPSLCSNRNQCALKRFSQETVELPIVQILVLVARSLTEILTEDDRSGERFRVAAHCDVGESVLSHCAEAALN